MFNVRFWGVRGSLAGAPAAHSQVGGNTSCIEVRCGAEIILLDAGTGARACGAALAAASPVPITLLLTHYHWDHIQGFPFFAPAYRPGQELRVCGPLSPAAPAVGVRELVAGQMRPPYFPVGLEVMPARLEFAGLFAGQTLQLGDVRVVTAPTRHPGGGLAYRIEHAGRAVVLATDTEHDPEAEEPDANLVALARGADLLVYDAQYTDREFANKRGWGHSTATAGVAVARAAGVSRLGLYHHDPAHDDWTVAAIAAEARAALPGAFAAREGLDIELAPPRTPDCSVSVL